MSGGRPPLRLAPGLLALVAGCALGPAPLAGPAGQPTGQPSTTTAAAATEAPRPRFTPPGPFTPSMPPPTPCVPAAAPYVFVQALRDRVLVVRCGVPHLQRVGRPPEPLAFRTDDLGLAWVAPDGASAIAMRRGPGEEVAAVVRHADGRPDTVLVADAGAPPVVSADGEYLALPDGRLVEVRTGEVRRVVDGAHDTDGGRPAIWSPDGHRLLFRVQDPEGLSSRLTWASWDEPERHELAGLRVDMFYAGLGWAGDGRHVLVCAQNPKSGQVAELLTLGLDGAEVDREPIVDERGQPAWGFVPADVQAGNPLVFGTSGLLDPRTGVVRPVADAAGLVGWSAEPGRLLRWRPGPGEPRLDTVPPDDLPAP